MSQELATTNVWVAIIALVSLAEFLIILTAAVVGYRLYRRATTFLDRAEADYVAPLAAKGYARLKPDSVGRNDKTKDAWADPFVEWLRYRGYFLSAMPVFFGPKAEQR